MPFVFEKEDLRFSKRRPSFLGFSARFRFLSAMGVYIFLCNFAYLHNAWGGGFGAFGHGIRGIFVEALRLRHLIYIMRARGIGGGADEKWAAEGSNERGCAGRLIGGVGDFPSDFLGFLCKER